MTGAIAVAGEQDNHLFTVAEPVELYFDLLTNRADLTWRLTGPAGEVIASTTFAYTDGNYDSSRSVLIVPGTYQLQVRGNGSATGSYGFRLLDLGSATALTLGNPVSGMLDPGNETDVYRVTATAGDRLFFDQQDYTGGNPYVPLLDPNGNTAYQGYFSNDAETATLGLSGDYTLLIEGFVNTSAPTSYSFWLNKIIDTTAALSLGATIDGTITALGQKSRFTFTLTEAKQVYFDFLSAASGLTWSLPGRRGRKAAALLPFRCSQRRAVTIFRSAVTR